METDKLFRVYFRLEALRKNLPKHDMIEGKYANEYNNLVDELEKESDGSLAEFKVPVSEIKPMLTSISDQGEEYSRENFCSKSVLLSKIDALLPYFSIKHFQHEKVEKPNIGFNHK